MKSKKNARIALVFFSFLLAAISVIGLVCGALLAGASDETTDSVPPQLDSQPVIIEETSSQNPDTEESDYVKEVVIDGVTYLEFAEGTTKEQIQKAIDEYVKKGFSVDYHEGKYTLMTEEDMKNLNFKYDISKHIEADNPTGIYVPVKGADLKVNVAAMIANPDKRVPYIHKFAGEERSAGRDCEFYTVINFCGDRDAFVGYLSTVSYRHDGSIYYAKDEYKAKEYKATYDTIAKRESSFERAAWFGENIMLGDPGSLYGSTARLVTDPHVATYTIKDYGTYLGRNAVRIAGTVTDPMYEDKTGMSSYEIIFDIETQAVMSFIAYDANGDIQSYTIITRFSMDDSIEVPLYPNINK